MKKTILCLALTLCLLLSFASCGRKLPPEMQKTKPIAQPETLSTGEFPLPTTEKKAEEPYTIIHYMPIYWYTPYAAVEIVELEEETAPKDKNLVRVQYKLLFSCNSYFDGSKTLMFGEPKLYITKKTAAKLSPGDAVFFRVWVNDSNTKEVTYTPMENKIGESELFFFENGKLDVDYSSFTTESFSTIVQLNQLIEDLLENLDRFSKPENAHLSERLEDLNNTPYPRKLFRKGMTVNEIREWFAEWETAREIAEQDAYPKFPSLGSDLRLFHFY